MISKEKNLHLFDNTAQAYAREFSTPTDDMDKFTEMIKPKAKILDLGCGTGNETLYLSGLGYNVTGVDFSDEMLAIAKAKDPITTYINQDLDNLKFPENSFDHAIAVGALHYLPKTNVPKCLGNIYKILRPEGLIFVKVWEGESAEITIPAKFPPNSGLYQDLNIMSMDEIERLMKESGFAIHKIISNQMISWIGMNRFCFIARSSKSK